jgi:imidazole glycerol-phosphate synthase subunit HisF
MLKHRVIPCLLLRNGGLVKTRRFKNPKYVGDPINAIRIFNGKEVDELMVLDILASKKSIEPNYSLIEQFAGECFMPLCYGGGVRTVEQAKQLFALGVEKICIQSAAIERPVFISELAEKFGSQSVVVSIDIKRNLFKKAHLFESRSGKTLSSGWLDFLRESVQRGAGEIVLNSVDRDGEMNGYDLQMIRDTVDAVTVPVIALGGAGRLEHFRQAVDAGAAAVSAGSLFVFQGPHRAVLISYPAYPELERLFES